MCIGQQSAPWTDKQCAKLQMYSFVSQYCLLHLPAISFNFFKFIVQCYSQPSFSVQSHPTTNAILFCDVIKCNCGYCPFHIHMYTCRTDVKVMHTYLYACGTHTFTCACTLGICDIVHIEYHIRITATKLLDIILHHNTKH